MVPLAMPDLGRTSKRAEPTKSPAKIDVGQARNPQNTATIRNRVLQWQAEWETNNDNNEEDGLGHDTQKKSPGRKFGHNKTATTREEEEALHSSGPDVRYASTPKKRVVSDEHWKKNTASTKPGLKAVLKECPEPAQAKVVSPFARTDPTSKKYDAWVRVRPRPKQLEKVSYEDLKQEAEELTTLPGRSMSPSRTEKPDVERWLGSVDMRGHNSPVEPLTSPRRDNANNASERRSPRNSKPPSVSSDEKHKIARNRSRSRLARRHARDVQDENASEQDRSSRAASVTEEDCAILQTRHPPTPPVFGSRIQTWLTSTPDPFQEITSPSSYDAHRFNATPEAGSGSKTLRVCTGSGGDRRDHDDVPGKLKILSYVYSDPKPDAIGNQHLSDDEPKCSSPTPALKRKEAKRNISSAKGQTPTPWYMGNDELESQDFSTNVASDASRSSQSFPVKMQAADHTAGESSGYPTTRTLREDPQTTPRTSSRLPVVSENTSKNHSQDVPQLYPQGSDLMYSFIKKPSEKRKLTSHADLISVLSLPRDSSRNLRSARSIRTARRKPGAATISEVMNQVRIDETRYARELCTLVDNVIPVLLNCAMSKTQSAKAGQLFGHQKNDANVTAPIVKMGIALERLKSSHDRISLQSPDAFILWAQGSHRVYADYIQAWRMGFQDVVVNSTAPDRNTRPKSNDASTEPTSKNNLSRDEDGYVVSDDGEKVDAAFLLKRPLVRLKHLSKSLENIFYASGSSPAKTWATKYQDLVDEARRKQEEERARLEDEAASTIDTTRSREPQSLAPLAGVQINSSRSVRARDFFDLRLQHSSGQQIDCCVELFIRDERGDVRGDGDVLICEVDSASRWLLFPPIPLNRISARNGDLEGEIFVSITGSASGGQPWRETLSLRSDDEQTGFEWVHLLGLSPVSPEHHLLQDAPMARLSPLVNHIGAHVRQLSAADAAMPIGEQASQESRRWDHQHFVEQRQTTQRETLVGLPTPGSQSGRTYYSDDHYKEQENDAASQVGNRQELQRPIYGRTSSTPSKQPPLIPKIRGVNGEYQSTSPNNVTIKRKEISSSPERDDCRGRVQTNQTLDPNLPHKNTSLGSPVSLRTASTPHFSQPVNQTDSQSGRRRASSPLKYQYQPSSSSGDSSISDDSSDDDQSLTSDSSTDKLELTTLPISQPATFGRRTISGSTGSGSIVPSQSASQAPYLQADVNSFSKTIASIFSWSEKGTWVSLFPEECSIIVSPGLIEAYELSAAHSHTNEGAPYQPQSARPTGTDPLVALELTPLVPLRRGTAIDISIRSPPTADSQIRSSNNVMFRSRNSQECEALYNMINQARINNPTYIAMQNARIPQGDSSWAAHMDRRGNKRNPSSWWRFGSRRNSYRSKGHSRPQSIAQTESSVATMSTAISALKRYSASGSRIFSMGKSTNLSQGRTERSSSSFTSSSGASTPVVETIKEELSLGISNAKVRLYQRETASRWQDKGPARLTIMHPPQLALANMSPGRLRQEKRIVVTGRSHDQPLLDVTLGETSFERVARTGIAVSVWEHLVGPNGEVGQAAHTGGVVATRVKVYMIQMKSEAEAAYTFSLVGRSRY